MRWGVLEKPSRIGDGSAREFASQVDARESCAFAHITNVKRPRWPLP